MKAIGRDKLRGAPLSAGCQNAKTVKDKRSGDPRTFCEGIKTYVLAGESFDKQTSPTCAKCPAYIGNKTPWDGTDGALPGQMTIDDFIK